MANNKKKKEKNKSLQWTEADIIKKFGETAIYRIGSRKSLNVKCLPTGIHTLDRAIGIGGYPRGRIVEIYGPESSAKTTLTLHSIAACQKKGGSAVFIDAEHAFDPKYAKRIGVDLDSLLISQPNFGEEGLDIVESLILSNKIDLIVVDSVVNLIPEIELTGDMGKETMGRQAAMMSKALRRMVPVIGKSKTCLIFLNQIRAKIGGYFGGITTPGGHALKHGASVRIVLRFKEKDKSLGGIRFVGIIKKNKVASPYEEFSFILDDNFRKSKGIIKWVDKVEAGISSGLISKKGSSLIYGKDKFKGMKTFKKKILDDKKRSSTYLKRLRKAIKEE